MLECERYTRIGRTLKCELKTLLLRLAQLSIIISHFILKKNFGVTLSEMGNQNLVCLLFSVSVHKIFCTNPYASGFF